ncbi:MAG: preprotein translocase subunit SecY [Dehalococcoidia bacterium]|nr:preprotein translocase subunit SecY [Dehalococcoidia bacterium]
MLEALINAWRTPDLRRKLLFTLGMLVIFRFVAHIPIPGVDPVSLNRLFQSNQLLGMLDMFSGGAMRNLSVASMGVYPYITASIIMQLMVPVIPALDALSKEGEVGRHRINRYTHWITVPLAGLQAFGQLALFQSQGVVSNVGVTGADLLPTLAMVISMMAGTVFLVWVGELITENGIGNGVSVIIFGGIVASLPEMVLQGFVGASGGGNFMGIVAFVVLGVGLVAAIVFFQEAQRRIPVQYTRSLFRGGRMYRQGGASHIPLRVNSAGMIPLIFAASIMIFPGTVASYFTLSTVDWVKDVAQTIQRIFDTASPLYWTLYGLLVVAFTFFYTIVIFQQQNLAENLQKNGGFVPGIRPGRPTAEYFNSVLFRITWAGALFLGLIAIMPYLGEVITGVRALQLSSTGLLIVVGVVLDTMRQLEAQLMMRNYEGFIK